MERLYYFLASTLVIVSLTACSDDGGSEEPKYPKVEITLTAEQKAICEDGQKFAWQLFDKVYQERAKEEKNILISPFSLNYALAMLQNGANGTTLDEILLASELSNYQLDEINKFYKHLADGLLKVDKSVIFNNANSIWYKKGFTVLDDFITTNKVYYNSEVREEDFADPKTVDIINQWCSDKTNKKIDKIIDQINGNAVMYLINAIYFKAHWENQFSKDQTKNETFTLANQSTVSTPFMHNEIEGAPFLKNDLFTFSALNFGNGGYQMFFVLPEKDVQINDLIEHLVSNWSSMNTTPADVTFALPKFETAFNIELTPTLQSLGMQQAFSNAADFSKITTQVGVKVSNVTQKTYIKIDEEGGEAAAVTSVGVETTAVNPSQTFRLDRPFLFGIRETSTGAILFVGHMTNPTLKE